ncbi:hypothetical protein [Flavobacterium cellulosilyticum]|uniref:Uncharacterized protein n=1 Tax=Flavobacterium cellulosilyticum TaxID=2541731 RepID=A0A4R5CCN7_9FLAO|nr:hypothetical protein [Flavobacterium cellulosilyticum]TDD96003.1 hypothetical protein E0F76_12910 [Flavobacterium cellulosilyticum]
MATRTTVESKITAINDKGNNTALEVRDVLTELLDYTENKPGLETFHIFSANAIISSGKNAKLFFSIKGIKGETANMTLLVKPIPVDVATDTNTAIAFVIPFNETQGMFSVENFNLLAGQDGKGILPLIDDRNFLTYQIPLFGNELNQGQLVIALARKFSDFNNVLIISVPNLKRGFISTSIAMHTQKFEESAIDPVTNNLGNVNVDSRIRNRSARPIDVNDISFAEAIFGAKFK